jgi:LDH2 family malate/lactate/ureidoglycolate dehydrogenase
VTEEASQMIVRADKLVAFCRETFLRAGLDPAGAEIVAESLLEADLRGVSLHGDRARSESAQGQ